MKISTFDNGQYAVFKHKGLWWTGIKNVQYKRFYEELSPGFSSKSLAVQWLWDALEEDYILSRVD